MFDQTTEAQPLQLTTKIRLIPYDKHFVSFSYRLYEVAGRTHHSRSKEHLILICFVRRSTTCGLHGCVYIIVGYLPVDSKAQSDVKMVMLLDFNEVCNLCKLETCTCLCVACSKEKKNEK